MPKVKEKKVKSSKKKKSVIESLEDSGAAEASKSEQSKAGLLFPVRRTEARLRFKTRSTLSRVAAPASVFLTAVVEHMVAHILGASETEISSEGNKRIAVRNIQSVVLSDPALAQTFAGFSFASTSTVPRAGRLILTKQKIMELEGKKAMRKNATPAEVEQ